jgi:hypothetical protein
MTTAACRPRSLPPQAAVPLRSPRTSLVLAEMARQRRWERRQRRQARRRRDAWLTLFDRAPYDSIGTCATFGVIFAGAMPIVYALRPIHPEPL